MGKQKRIPKEVKIDIERIVRRYPSNKTTLVNLDYDVILATHPNADSRKGNITSENKPQSVTEGKALQLMNPYYDRIRREVAAVEYAMKKMDPEKVDIIKKRFWTKKDKNIAFDRIDTYWSYETMKITTRAFLFYVGLKMGMIEVE